MRVLIIGAGRIAGLNELESVRKKPCTHLGAIRSQPSLEVAGVVDSDTERAAAFASEFSIPWSGASIAEALEAVRPDIVTVAVPYALQHDVVMAIAASSRRPRRLLLEKPLADSLEKAEEIAAACRRTGIATLVNNECGAPVIDQVRDALAGRFCNDVISVSAWCSSGMHAVGIHMLGILRYLFGPIAWVRAIAETEPVERLPFSTNFTPDDPRFHALLCFETGLTGFLTNSALTRYTYKELEVTCRTGKLRLSANGLLLQVWGAAAPGNSTISYRLAEPETVAVDSGTVFSRIGDFLASDDDAAGQGVLGIEAALDTYRTLDAMIRSAREARDAAPVLSH